MTAPDRTTDALASALPAGIFLVPRNRERWNARKIAAFQAEKLAESGYVLVHTAPDEATIERLAQSMHDNDGPRMPWSELPDSVRLTWRRTVRMALAALCRACADVSATADEATGGA